MNTLYRTVCCHLYRYELEYLSLLCVLSVFFRVEGGLPCL